MAAVQIALAVLLLAGLSACDELDISAEDVVFGDKVYSQYEADADPDSAPASYTSDEARPVLETPFSSVNLGRVTLGKKVEHILAIRNGGDANLLVYQLLTTCDYISATLSAGEIPPGKIALLTVTIDATNDPEPAGTTIRRGIIIVSNDPAQPELTIWIQASIEAP